MRRFSLFYERKERNHFLVKNLFYFFRKKIHPKRKYYNAFL